MQVTRKQKLLAAVVAATAVAGGGAALAASKFGSPSEESQAVVNDSTPRSRPASSRRPRATR